MTDKKREIQLCPKCKQPTLHQATNVSGWLDSSSYRCTDPKCGYMGRFFIMVNPDELTRQEAGNRQGEAPKDGAENG
nr:hypothetical protein [Candidatus Sigynarchaeum springense]MDO8118805.1 hypothetical protein [Candidatus Sigynarchaeota archaeon]